MHLVPALSDRGIGPRLCPKDQPQSGDEFCYCGWCSAHSRGPVEVRSGPRNTTESVWEVALC